MAQFSTSLEISMKTCVHIQNYLPNIYANTYHTLYEEIALMHSSTMFSLTHYYSMDADLFIEGKGEALAGARGEWTEGGGKGAKNTTTIAVVAAPACQISISGGTS